MIKERIKRREPLLAAGGAVAALVIACTGAGDKEEPTPTQAPDTPQPTRTIETIVPTEKPASEQIQEKGVLSYKDWEIGIISWQEQPSQREGWKNIYIRALARNSSAGLLAAGGPGGLYFGSLNNLAPSEEKLLFSVNAGGSTFSAESYVEDDKYTEDAYGVIGLGYTSTQPGAILIPGYAVPIAIKAEVPQIHEDYSLSSGLSPNMIQKGEVAQNFPQILPIYQEFKGQDEVWNTPLASVKFNGIFTASYNYRDEQVERQIVSLDIQNNLGDQDVIIEHTFATVGFFVGIHLQDGRILHGNGLIDLENNDKAGVLAPGLRKTFYLPFGSLPLGGGLFDETYNTQGATVVIFHRYSINSYDFAVWKLP